MTEVTQQTIDHRHTRRMITTRADEEECNSLIAIAKSAASVQLVGVGNAR